MVESSKILTVSYGTFSCTLEGFEDSFSTMKAIAEYFRDLAAGDRYFGAEPPTPDAEMLARIAEREISRRVEMRTSETGIVLRASDPMPQRDAPPLVQAPAMPAAVAAGLSILQPQAQDSADDATAAAAQTDAPAAGDADARTAEVAPVMPPAPRRPAAAEARRDQSRAAADDAEVTQVSPAPARPKAEAPAHPDADSVAAKLQRIRAVVGGVTATPAATSAFAEDLEEAEPAAAPLPDLESVAVAEAAPEATVAPIGIDAADPTDAGDAEPAMEAEDEADDLAMPQADTDTDDDAPEDDITADVPQAALSDAETDAAIARAMAVFGGADTTDAEPADDAPVAAADDRTATADAATNDDTDDQISAVLRNLERAGLRSPQRDAPETASAPDAVEPSPAPQPSPRGRILRVTRRPRPEEQAESTATTSAGDDAAQRMAENSPQAPQPAAKDDAADDLRTTSSVAAMIAAAQKAKRAASQTDGPVDSAPELMVTATAPTAVPQVDAMVSVDDDMDDTAVQEAEVPASASVATLDGAEDLTGFDATDPGSSLSEEDEADLQRTLAALKAEVEDDAPAAPVPAPRTEAVQKPRREELPDTSEAEMSRIMSQANEELADPEASRRRNAIAHLKAAVAATEAARQLGEADSAATVTEDAFRDDLEQVVRPRRAPRPEVPAERSERPRPAPLKLVASQRIDLDDAADVAPVQPRRVATAAGKADDAGNFAEFAESMGATSLQDLLEAAAAYTAYVEGSEDFSRPHIMQKVRQTVTEDFSREDGLRSFGTLLRQGRIERSRNGRFTVTEGIRFKPDSMAAGG